MFGDAVREALKIRKPYSEESQEHLLLHCQADNLMKNLKETAFKNHVLKCLASLVLS